MIHKMFIDELNSKLSSFNAITIHLGYRSESRSEEKNARKEEKSEFARSSKKYPEAVIISV